MFGPSRVSVYSEKRWVNWGEIVVYSGCAGKNFVFKLLKVKLFLVV